MRKGNRYEVQVWVYGADSRLFSATQTVVAESEKEAAHRARHRWEAHLTSNATLGDIKVVRL